MSTPNDGGPAFPVENAATNNYAYAGMSLRDWFAGKALEGIMSRELGARTDESIACEALDVADAMIAARGKVPDLATEGGRDE